MDIPSRSTDDGKQKITVTTSSTSKTPSTPETITEKQPDQPVADMKDDALTKEEARRKNIAEIIETKKYFLPIKEKRSKPLVTPWEGRKKAVKHKVTATKNTAQKTKVSTESSRAKKIKLLVVAGLWIGAYLVIDAGLIDIGWRPPAVISIFNRNNAGQTDVFTLPAQGVGK